MPAPKPLTAQQRRAVEALLAGRTKADAAREANVAETTLHRWYANNPAFVAEMERGRREGLKNAVDALRLSACRAVERLKAEMDSPSPNPVRITAADKILTHAMRLGEATDMAAKVEELEKRIAAHEARTTAADQA